MILLRPIALTAVVILSLSVSKLEAGLVYSMDFSVDGQGATHDTAGDTLETSPVTGANWTLTFDSASIGSDGTTNEFRTTGGVMRVQDWGGAGIVTSVPISITSDGTVDIVGAGLTIGTDVFNTVGTEGITWFYALGGGANVEAFFGETELGGPVSAGTSLGHTFSGIAVSDGDVLRVGFGVNVNGSGDGVEISSLSVDFNATAVPEPTSFAMLSLLLVSASCLRVRSQCNR